MKITNKILNAALLISLTANPLFGESQTQTDLQPQKQPSVQLDFQKANPDSEFGGMDFDNLPPEQLEKVKAVLAQMMDNMVTKIIQQTGRIEELLQDLSLSVNNNAIGVDNKEELLKQIKQIRTVVESIKKEAFVEVEPHTLQFLLSFNEALMEHLSEAIKNGFKEIPAIDDKLATLQKRMVSISIDNIEDKLLENEEQLAKLQVEAQQIGLRWYNHLFRKFNSFLIIAHRRKWDTGLIGVSLFGTIAAHAMMRYSPFGYSKAQKLREKAARLEIKKRYFNAVESEKANIKIKKYNDLAEKAENNERIDGVPFYSKPFRFFRKIIGMPPILNKEGEIADLGEFSSKWNSKNVTWFGRTDLTVKIVGGILIGAYLPIIRFVYPAWSSDLGNWVGKKMASVYGRLLGGVAAKKAREQKEDDEGMEPKYTFDDVVGLDHIKEILNRILEYVKDPERFDRANIPPERGYLFTGLPGTGKSFVAEAFGGEIRKIFKEVGRSEDELGFYSFTADFINEKGIGWLLNLAKKESPCIIFIDEIDLLRLQRGGNNNPELLSEFLGSMSGVLSKESGKQVILLAATNRPEHLDRALRRRGRFGKIIHFELPTLGERRAFFVKKLDPLIPDLSTIDTDKLAQETEGRTYEELTAMTNAAFQKTKILGQPLTQQHLENSLDEEIRNIINKDMHVSEQEQELIATHQAGHALALEILRPRRELASVTIKPITADLEDEPSHAGYYGKRKQKDVIYGKVFTRCSFDHRNIQTRKEKIKECKILLSGMAAERVILGSCSHSYHTNDKQEALDLVKSLVFEGLHVKTMPKKLQLQYFEKALELLQQYEKETEELLREHKDILYVIAQELRKYKTLSARKVKALFKKPVEGEVSMGDSAKAIVA